MKKTSVNLTKKALSLIIFLSTGLNHFKIEQENANYSIEIYLDKTNMLLNTYVPFKKMIGILKHNHGKLLVYKNQYL